MEFRFNVNLTDADYLDYNKFWMLRSPYGKKQILSIRIMLVVLFSVFILISLFGGGFSLDSFIGIIPLLILLIVSELLFNRFFIFGLKNQIKSLKKSGKMGYSPSSVLEFYNDKFVETTEENKTEQKYTAVERISIVDNKVIYIQVNNIMAYTLPLSSFESKEEYNSFLEFIKTKCNVIDVY